MIGRALACLCRAVASVRAALRWVYDQVLPPLLLVFAMGIGLSEAPVIGPVIKEMVRVTTAIVRAFVNT